MLITQVVPLLLLLCCFMQVGNSEVTQECINLSEIQKRARVLGCPRGKDYHYIWSPADGTYKERCLETKMVPKGYMTVLDQRSNHIDSVECPDETFQPTAYPSNTQCNCSFFKSKCDTTGSVIISKGSTYEDRTCGCDYKRGFDFQHTPNNICFCQPMHENCSCTCYSGNCETGTNLSHGDNNETTMNTTQWVAVSCLIGIVGVVLGLAVGKKKKISKYFRRLVPKGEDRSLRNNDDQGKCENDCMLTPNNGANQWSRTGTTFQKDVDKYSGTGDHSLSDFASKSKHEQGGVQPLGPRHGDDDDNKA